VQLGVLDKGVVIAYLFHPFTSWRRTGIAEPWQRKYYSANHGPGVGHLEEKNTSVRERSKSIIKKKHF